MSIDAKRFGVGTDKAAELERRFEKLGIREDDLVEKFIRSSGPGGQKVNKTSSAVQLKHVPSGIEVKAQGSRSQALNRFSARRQLADKLDRIIEGKRSAEAQRIAKVRRQKRKRSKRAKNKMLDQKRKLGAKKQGRQKVRGEE